MYSQSEISVLKAKGEVMVTSKKRFGYYQNSELRHGHGVNRPSQRKPLKWGETTPTAPHGKDDAIVITDAAGEITLANGAALSILGAEEFYMRRKTCNMMLFEGLDCPHTELSYEHPSVEREALSRAGDHLFNIRVSKLENADGRVYGFVHVIRDEKKEVASKRPGAQVERMSLTGLMVSAVAHEVATPLSVIANIAELLLLDSEQGSPTAVELKKIVTQAMRISEMTSRMLDFIRHKPAEFTVVDLARLTRETLDLVGYELRKALIQVSIEIAPDRTTIWGDLGQLQQVLLNLITNAIQAMKDGGLLVVRISECESATKNGRAVLLSIEDTGPGISDQELDRMFEFFFTTKGAEGGTGLGLALSKQIIEGHGGSITGENIRGGGARLSITLPAIVAEQSPAAFDPVPIARAQHNSSL